MEIDWQGVEDYTNSVGKRPKLIMHYLNFDPFNLLLLKPIVKEIAAKPYDYYAQIGLDFYSYPKKGKYNDRKDISRDISIHGYDMVLENLAIFFKEIEIPVFLRLGYEFGGNGFGYKYNPQDYVSAWQHIVTYFREAKVNNVAFVWNNLDEMNYMSFYPGDEYVDWWAINIFDLTPERKNQIINFVVDADRHRKPVMIAESTPREIGTANGIQAYSLWFKPYFDLIDNYPQIKAFCYLNASWADFPDKSFSQDCRLQANARLAQQYRVWLSQKKFINAAPND
ncbi:MAG: glycosyl hydrolase [Calditrichia bacterium]